MVSHKATNAFYRNVINNNKIAPNKQASIIGSKEWDDEKWSSVLLLNNSNIGGKIGGILVNHLSYADDVFDLFELSWNDSTFKYLWQLCYKP